VSLGGRYQRANAAYEDGRLFTVNVDGVMRAFDAATGEGLWSMQLPDKSLFSGPPVARGRKVFVAGVGPGGAMFGVSGLTGEVLWTQSVEGGDGSAPAVTESGVYGSWACVQAYKFAPDTGQGLWHYDSWCSGGGGMTPALIANRLYAPDFAGAGPLVLDPLTGESLGTFATDGTPAGTAQALFVMKSGALMAFPHGSSTATWTVPALGYSSAPIVVGAHVVVGTNTSMKVVVVSAATGELVSSDLLEAAVTAGSDVGYVGAPLSGLAAANNHLFVPAGQYLYSY